MTTPSHRSPRGRSASIELLALLGPLVAGAVAVWLVADTTSFLLVNATLLWGASLLLFAAGRGRGLGMLSSAGSGILGSVFAVALFLVGFLATAATVWAFPMAAVGLLIAGTILAGLLDLGASRRGERELLFSGRVGLGAFVALLSLVSLAGFIWQSPFL